MDATVWNLVRWCCCWCVHYGGGKSIVLIKRWLLLLRRIRSFHRGHGVVRPFQAASSLFGEAREGGFTMGPGRCSEGGLEVQQPWVNRIEVIEVQELSDNPSDIVGYLRWYIQQPWVIWQWLKIRIPNDPQEWSYLVRNHLFGVSIIWSHTHIVNGTYYEWNMVLQMFI